MDENKIPDVLSGRELQIASAYAAGANYRQIAERLCIAPATVRTHLGTIYRKLGVSTKIELLRMLDVPEGGEAGPPAGPRGEAAGRRPVTVLCATLDEMPRVALRGDPEAAAALAERFGAVVREAVGRHGGRLHRGQHGEVCACFGLPVSDETDPERAVRCALDAAARLRRLSGPDGAPVLARIGVATGMVIAAGGGEDAPPGGAPFLAAALGRTAAGGGVVVCTRTRAALGARFAFTEGSIVEIDRAAEPVRCFRVAEAVAAESRFAAIHGCRVPPIVGRDHEVGLLANLFATACGGEGQIALISGEPGIGKSRVVRALCDRLPLPRDGALVFQCSPHEQASPLHPIARTLRALAGVEGHESGVARLEALLELCGPLVGKEPLDRQVLAELAGIGSGAQAPVAALSPERLRAATLALLDRLVADRAARGPLVLVFEDMQWADPTTVRWLEQLAGWVESQPILAIATARPEWDWPSASAPRMTRLALARLGREPIGEIVAQQGGVLSGDLVERIVRRSEGIPLFAEELARAVVELGEGADEVPSTLHALLAGRLDRLGPAREVAQAASVLGRDFDAELLAEVLPDRRRMLASALKALVASRLVLRRGGSALQFKHALVRDAAYDGLLQGQREALHARVAEALIARGEAGRDVAPELIAHHLVEGGAAERSLPFWCRAAERATRRSANREAVAHVERGLAALRGVAEEGVRLGFELELKLLLGTPLIALSGYTGKETVAAYARARELAERQGDPERLFQSLYGVWVRCMIRGEHAEAHGIARRLVALALDSGSTAQAITARRVLGFSLSLTGRLAAGQRELEAALGLYRREEHGGLLLRFGQDPAIAAMSILAWSLRLQGEGEASRELAARALREADALGHSYSLAYATYVAGATPCFLAGAFGEARRHGERLVALSLEQGFPFWKAFGLAMRAALEAREGWVREAERAMGRALTELDAMGVNWFRPFIHASLADGLVAAGRPEMAARHVGHAQAISARTGEAWIAPFVDGLAARAGPAAGSEGHRLIRR